MELVPSGLQHLRFTFPPELFVIPLPVSTILHKLSDEVSVGHQLLRFFWETSGIYRLKSVKGLMPVSLGQDAFLL